MAISLHSETANMREDSGVREVNRSDFGKLLESQKLWTHGSLAELDQLGVEDEQVSQDENKIKASVNNDLSVSNY